MNKPKKITQASFRTKWTKVLLLQRVSFKELNISVDSKYKSPQKKTYTCVMNLETVTRTSPAFRACVLQILPPVLMGYVNRADDFF